MSKKILFLTGKLAERQLTRILKAMKPEFSYKINQIGVSVAALMSENIIIRRVPKENNFDKIIVPGKFRGNLEKLSKYFEVPVTRGPDDLTHLPDYFGIDSSSKKLIERLVLDPLSSSKINELSGKRRDIHPLLQTLLYVLLINYFSFI